MTPKPRNPQQAAAIAQAYRERREPNAMLGAHIRKVLERQGHFVDTYDPDFLLGTIVAWLGEHDAILTPSGVESRRVPDYEEDL